MESRTELELLNHLEKTTQKQRYLTAESITKHCKHIKTPVELRVVEATLQTESASAIAEHTGILGPSVSRVIQKLAYGRDVPLVTIEMNKDDNRIVDVTATKAACADYRRYKKGVGEW